MTREEALKVLKYRSGWNLSIRDVTALNMAIEALEQEPCENTISRQDALDALHMCLSTNSYDDDVTGDSYICYEEAEYEIEKLPSVQPKIKQEYCEDAISREDALMCMTGEYLVDKEYKPEDIISKHIRRLRALPSVQPKYNAEEWCKDCSEYDHEKHCCPRYNGVIRKAVDKIAKAESEESNGTR